MLMVTVALIYAMFLKTQTKPEELPPELVQSSPAAAARPSAHTIPTKKPWTAPTPPPTR